MGYQWRNLGHSDLRVSGGGRGPGQNRVVGVSAWGLGKALRCQSLHAGTLGDIWVQDAGIWYVRVKMPGPAQVGQEVE